MPESISTAFPKTTLQTCIVHLIRHSLEYAGWKVGKPLAAALRLIYTAPSADAALLALNKFFSKTTIPELRTIAICATTCFALFLQGCVAPANKQIPSYPANLSISVSDQEASKHSRVRGFEFDIPESQISYMDWSVMNRRWLNIDAMVGSIHRAVRNSLGANQPDMFKGLRFKELLDSGLKEAIKLKPKAMSFQLTQDLQRSQSTLYLIAFRKW